ncbi:MAG: phage/plasmid replication protein, II/X family [Clostridia bacterium]
MIDTVKIFTLINKKTYDIIKNKSNIKCMYNDFKRQVYYEIINDSLKGSYDSSLSVRVDEATRYSLKGYVLEIEGSYHKIVKGHNAFDGFYNIQSITLNLKKLVEDAYNLKLPSLRHWFLQRLDITKSYNLDNQDNVKNYINNFRLLSYPRRNLKFYENECVYVPGGVSTLKIYNKYREFLKNDKSKFNNFNDFDIDGFLNKIQGYVRFECEIKKKKLSKIFLKRYIRINNLDYKIFENVWCDEFMKMLKFDYSKLEKVKDIDSVQRRLNTLYKNTKASVLYAFYLTVKIDGYNKVKSYTTSSTFYRKIKELKYAGIDFSQNFSIVVDENKFIDFNPFNFMEVS